MKRLVSYLMGLLLLLAPPLLAYSATEITSLGALLEEGESQRLLDLPSITEIAQLDKELVISGLSLDLLETSEGRFQPPRTWETVKGVAAEEANKLDPILRMLLRGDQKEREAGRSLNLARFANLVEVYSGSLPLTKKPIPTGVGEFIAAPPQDFLPGTRADEVGVLIKTRGPIGELELAGVRIVSVAGEVVIARVTLQQLRQIAQLPQVIYVEASYRLEPELDKSLVAVGADRLHLEEPIAEGAGVIVGDVDTGIDYEQLDFRVDEDGDGFEESSRILSIWDQTETESFGNRGAVPFGTEYTREDIEFDIKSGYGPGRGVVRQRDENGHGTHVMGTAAGDGSSSGTGYIGVAPKAEIIEVKTTFFTGDVAAGVSYIFMKAEELSRPSVVNLSLGGHFGPHDGTSNFEQSLVGMLAPGRVIANSAGNEGNDPIHISGRLARKGDKRRFDFIPAESTVLLNFWYPGEACFSIELETPGTDGLPQIITAASGEARTFETRDGEVSVDNASGGPNPNNGDKQIAVLLDGVSKGKRWSIKIISEGGGGRFDGWPALASMGEFLQGDSQMTISEPGNGEEIVTVGAYTTRYKWRSIDGNEYHFQGASPEGAIASFSSHGPTRDGRQKPDISAPGTAIASSLARGSELAEIRELVVPDEAHVILQGTSMAAPHVAGTVALMLQAEGNLQTYEIAGKLRGTHEEDSFTGRLPNEVWGFGKLNAKKSVETIGLPSLRPGDRPEVKAGSNPASERTFFHYSVVDDAKDVRLIIFNVVGKVVFEAELDPKENSFKWDLVNDEGEPLANGLYIFVIIADGNRSWPPRRLVIRR